MSRRAILAATDGCEHSDRAVEHAARVAHATGATLHVVSVIAARRAPERCAGEPARLNPAQRMERVREQVVRLSGALAIHSELSLFREDGPVAPRLAEIADRLGAEAIVVGGRRGAPMTVGSGHSVVARLAHLTVRPIVVVPGAALAIAPRIGAVRRLRGDHVAVRDVLEGRPERRG